MQGDNKMLLVVDTISWLRYQSSMEVIQWTISYDHISQQAKDSHLGIGPLLL